MSIPKCTGRFCPGRRAASSAAGKPFAFPAFDSRLFHSPATLRPSKISRAANRIPIVLTAYPRSRATLIPLSDHGAWRQRSCKHQTNHSASNKASHCSSSFETSAASISDSLQDKPVIHKWFFDRIRERIGPVTDCRKENGTDLSRRISP
jgi:hypothetical protein